MSHDDDKKFINYVPVSIKTHEYLIQRANAMGMKVSDYVGHLADNAAKAGPIPKDTKDPTQRFFWNMVRFQRKRLQYEDVYRMVSLYQQMGEREDHADIVQEQCRIAGLDMAELMTQVGKDPLSSLVAQAQNGTKTLACLSWLSNTLRLLGGEAPASVIRSLADKEGYHKQMLDRVRTKIKDSESCDLYIDSRKEGKGWMWFFVSKETDEPILFEGATSPYRKKLSELGIAD